MNIEIIEWILVPIGVCVPMLMIIKSYYAYKKYLVAKEKANEEENWDDHVLGSESGGSMIAGTFYFRAPLPITDYSTNEDVQITAKNYNRIIKIYWIWSILGTACIIIILNLLNKYFKT